MNAYTRPGALLTRSAHRTGLVLAGTGAVAFVGGIVVGDGVRAWQTLLVNFLFFGGLAYAGVALSAVMHVTSARWARPLKRLAEATVAFLPAAGLLLLALLAGTPAWAPWVHEPIDAKAPWLNVPFFVIRQVLAFLLLAGISARYVYRSLRPDIGLLEESGHRRASGVSRRLIADWRGITAEREVGQRAQDRLAPGLLVAYAWVFSLVAFDLVMALEPHWYSTLMGAYYFVGNLFIGIAFLTVVAVVARHRLGLHGLIGAPQMHDIGKLLFGFSILWAYLVWSQYLVIWYGDLPEETAFIQHRLHGTWAPVTWAMLGLAFAAPFVVLLSRAVKTHPGGLATVAAITLVGMWLERFLLVAPSIWSGDGVPFGIIEVAITVGVLGLFGVCYARFLDTFPALVVSDPKLAAASEAGGEPPGTGGG